MLQLLITVLVTAAPVEVDVTTLDDRTYRGEVQEISADAIVLKTGDEKVSLPLAILISVAPVNPPPPVPVKGDVWIDLVDGSRLPLEQFGVRSGKVSVTLVGGEKLELPVSQLRRVQFMAQDDAVRKLWNGIAASPLKGDAVVVRKGGDGKPIVLDYLEGAIGDVSDAAIAFTLDGDAIGVNRQKVQVEGLLYYRPAGERVAAFCRIDDVRGAAWSAKSLALSEDNVELATATGVKHALPLADVVQFDFSLGKIIALSDLEPLKAEWQPYLSTASLTPGARQMFGVRRDLNFSGKPLTLGETKFRKGLALHSRSEVAYRLPGEFSRFVATVGIDPAQRSRGHVRLEIRGDNRVLLDEPIAGGDKPRAIELDVAGVGRLTILVDYGDGLDIGDQLILGNARFIR